MGIKYKMYGTNIHWGSSGFPQFFREKLRHLTNLLVQLYFNRSRLDITVVKCPALYNDNTFQVPIDKSFSSIYFIRGDFGRIVTMCFSGKVVSLRQPPLMECPTDLRLLQGMDFNTPYWPETPTVWPSGCNLS